MKILSQIILACFFFVACNSALDLDPITQQTEKLFYRTEADAFQALTSVYDVLQWSAPRSQNCAFEVISEQIGDCCYGGGGNANDVPFIVKMSRWNMDPNDASFDALWYKYYAGIYRANVFLQKIDGIAFKDESIKKQMIAEAYFLRANFYFDLVRLFGHVPLITKPLEPADYYNQNQVEPSIIYAQIKTDLVFAIENGLPNRTAIASNQTGRLSKHAAEALLTRVWLYYTGAYNQTDLAGLSKTKITEYIEDVVLNSGASLMPNYADLFSINHKNNSESIFEIQYSTKSAWGDWGYREGSEGNQAVILWGIRDPQGSSPYSTGWGFAPVRSSLWTTYAAGDSRRDATLINMDVEGFTYKPGYQNTGIFNKKFTPLKVNEPTSGSRELNFANNYPCIRFADVLLMAAELQITSNTNKAQKYYELVVNRAMGASYVVPTVSSQLIFKERLLELALEGHRYWDIRRQGLDQAKKLIEAENAHVTSELKKTFDVKYQGLMPIPQTQLTLCKQLIQNPGY